MTERDVLYEIMTGEYELSVSRLKRLLYGDPQRFLANFNTETDATLRGKITEHLLYNNLENKHFTISTAEEPTGQLKIFADSLLKHEQSKFLDYIYSSETHSDEKAKELLVGVEEAYIESEAKRDSSDKMVSRLLDFKDYFIEKTKGDVVISQELFDKSYRLAEAILADPNVSKLFSGNILPQHELKWEMFGVKCKGYPDHLKVNEQDKTVEIVDLKTCDRNPFFTAKEDRWDLQGAFYYHGACSAFPDYRVHYPIFVAIETGNHRITRMRMTDADVHIATNGATINGSTVEYFATDPTSHVKKTTYEIKGLKQLIELYTWHRDNKEWEMSKDWAEKNEFEMKLFYS